MWITSLVLTWKFQIDRFKIMFLGGVEAAIRLGIKSWFADVGLSTSDSILDLLSLFNLVNISMIAAMLGCA